MNEEYKEDSCSAGNRLFDKIHAERNERRIRYFFDEEEEEEEIKRRCFRPEDIENLRFSVNATVGTDAFPISIYKFYEAMMENSKTIMRYLADENKFDIITCLIESLDFIEVQKWILPTLVEVFWWMHNLNSEICRDWVSATVLCEKINNILINVPENESVMYAIDLATELCAMSADLTEIMRHFDIINNILNVEFDDHEILEFYVQFICTLLKGQYAEEELDVDGFISDLSERLLYVSFHCSDKKIQCKALSGLDEAASNYFCVFGVIGTDESIYQLTEMMSTCNNVGYAAGNLILSLSSLPSETLPMSVFLKHETVSVVLENVQKEDPDMMMQALHILRQWLGNDDNDSIKMLLERFSEVDLCETYGDCPYKHKIQLLELIEKVVETGNIEVFATENLTDMICEYILTEEHEICLRAINIMSAVIEAVGPETEGFLDSVREAFESSDAFTTLRELSFDSEEQKQVVDKVNEWLEYFDSL